jgi:hypothetical protein
MTLCLVNSLQGFLQSLGSLPQEVKIIQGKKETCDLTIWFCSSQNDLVSNISDIVAQSKSGPV